MSTPNLKNPSSPLRNDPELDEKGLMVLFQERISIVIDALGGATSAAKEFDISREALYKWKTGKARPPLMTVAAMCSASGYSINWLMGLMDKSQAIGLSGFAFVPRLEVTASAGNGSFAISEDTEGMLAFRSDWLRDRGINPKMASALTVAGDSMEPVIRDGDILLVDRSIDHVKDNGIYVVVIGDLIVVKRVHTGMDGSVTLISDNTIYPTETIPPNEVDDLIFAGRVMWFGRSI